MMQTIPDSIDLSAYMDEVSTDHRVLPASSWIDKVVDHFHKPDTTPKVRLPWLKTHADFFFRPAEVTLWAGINSHGKSQVVGQVAHSLCAQGERVAEASLEMEPDITMARMTQQAFGGERPTEDYLRLYGQWTDGKLWLYDHLGQSDPKTMCAVIRYAIDKFKVTHFVVDNLMKVIRGEQGEKVYNEQKDFVNSLCNIAKDLKIHIHLVLHIKKLEKEGQIPNKFDIKGSGAITDLVDNIFIVWRNKEKEAAIRAGDDYKPDDPDCLLILDKQRHKGLENRYRLYFDRSSLQYLEHHRDLPKQFKPEIGVDGEAIIF